MEENIITYGSAVRENKDILVCSITWRYLFELLLLLTFLLVEFIQMAIYITFFTSTFFILLHILLQSSPLATVNLRLTGNRLEQLELNDPDDGCE